MFNDARNMVSYVDGHASYIKIYWNNTLSYPNGASHLQLITIRPKDTITDGVEISGSICF